MGFYEKWRGFIDGGKSVKAITHFNSLFGWSNNVTKFNQANAYALALELSEVFNPIDAIATRASSVRYEIRNLSGNPIIPSARQHQLLQRPNPLSRFSDLVYSMVFSELSDGNRYLYRYCTSEKPLPDMITSIWCIAPNLVSVKYKKASPSFFEMTDISDLVEHYAISANGAKLSPDAVVHDTSTFLKSNGRMMGVEGRSPLCAVEKNINALLAVYEARYKVYVNNGAAGILSRASESRNGDIESMIASPAEQVDIIKELREDVGLTKGKNIWGTSSVPLKFIKTLASISELQPFDETEADATAIAGIFGVEKELIPNRKFPTYANKKAAEVTLWQNVIKGVCEDVCPSLNRAFLLPENQTFVPIYDDVECLAQDDKTRCESDKLILENIKLIKEAGLSDDSVAKKIIERYENIG